MKTTLSLLKAMPVAGLLCTAVLLLCMPVRLRALSPGEADTLQVYRDSIRWSSNNVQKSEWLERAAVYSLRVGDTASLLSFKIDQAYFRFSSGNYVEAFDSLILIEKKNLGSFAGTLLFGYRRCIQAVRQAYQGRFCLGGYACGGGNIPGRAGNLSE